VGKIGENITPRRFVKINAKGKLASYVHGSKIGVLAVPWCFLSVSRCPSNLTAVGAFIHERAAVST
jgi:translation elongation factor EF-Ts